MALKTQWLFPTLIGTGTLPGAASLNRRLLEAIDGFMKEDRLGKEWSRENYRGGYTSYGSLSDMHHRHPLFARIEELMAPRARAFATAQRWDLRGMELEMTACWINVMPRHTYHTLHLHPHSAVSGTYYVTAPKGSASLKIEDPRMGFYMNAPLKKESARKGGALYHEVEPRPGSFVLFESWLRHEVPPNQSAVPRVSISFNYGLEPRRT